MPVFTLPRLVDDAEASWHILADLLGLPPPVATAVWQVLCASQKPECRALRYHLVRCFRAPAASQRRELVALFYGPGRGPRLVALFEDFVRSGRLTPEVATCVQEALLARMGAGGQRVKR